MSATNVFNIHESLNSDELRSKWQKAINAANMSFQEVVFLADGLVVRHHYEALMGLIVRKLDLSRARDIVGMVSLKELFDEEAVLFEVEFTINGETKKIEIFFDESGRSLHGALT